MKELWASLKKIVALAIPSSIGFMILIMLETANIFWVGRFSSDAVASVGEAAFFEWMLFSLMNLTTVGCSTFVSQALGAGSKQKAFYVIRGAWQLSMFISLILMILLIPTVPTLFFWAGLRGNTHQMAVDYFTIFVLALPILYTLHLQTHVFNAYKDARTATMVMGLTVAINMGLDPLLILGKGGFPRLGAQGGAIASVLSQSVGVLIRFWLLRRKNYIEPLKQFFKIRGDFFRPILQVGIPSATTNVVWTMVFPFLSVIITQFGMSPLAGLNVGNRIESFPYYASMGLAWAVSVLVGHACGRGDRLEAIRLVKIGVGLITCVLLPVSLLFIFIPEFFVGLLNNDPEIIRYGSDYLRIIGYFEIFLGWELLLEGAFNGFGQTRTYMLIRVPLTLIRIPVGWFLAIPCGWGVSGIWWAITISTFLKGLFLFVGFFLKVPQQPKREIEPDLSLSSAVNLS